MTYTSHGNRSILNYFWQILEYYRYIPVYFLKWLFLVCQGCYFYFLYALRSPNRRSTLSALRSTLTYGCRPSYKGPIAYTKYHILVSPILIILLNTNCKPRYSVTNTKCQPNITCHSLQIYNPPAISQLLSLTKRLFI
jgi:hypothetical protein